MGITDATFTPVPVVEVIEELGTLAPGSIAKLVGYSTKGLIKGVASYEDLPYDLDALFGIATPTGGPGSYIYAYTAPTIAAPSPRINSFEFNQPGYAYLYGGNLLRTWMLEIESAKMWAYQSAFLGTTDIVTTLSVCPARAVEAITAAETIIYVDAFGAAPGIGQTAFPNTGVKATLAVDTGRHTKQFIGNALPTDWGFNQWSGTLKLTCELNTASKALLDVIAQANPQTLQRQFRFKATSLATGHIAQVDFAGVCDSLDDLFGDREGNQTITLNFKGNVDVAGLGNWLAASVTNGIAALT
jgi:hypothetical protein